MRKTILTCLMLLATSLCLAEWTTDKDKILAEMLQERIVAERDIQSFIKAGYTELTSTKLLKYLDEKEKQTLLNELIDEKVTHQEALKAEADAESLSIEANITSLTNLQETP